MKQEGIDYQLVPPGVIDRSAFWQKDTPVLAI
jgi:hypothetical protein